jgi:hypothetical protein
MHLGIRGRAGVMIAGSVIVSASIAFAPGSDPASAAASAPQGGAPCGSSFDPYNYTAAQIAACGYSVYPAQAPALLPAVKGGSGTGTAVSYKLGNAVVATQLIPPSGFRPETASASELEQYGFPARPSGGEALARWQMEMSKWQGSAPAAPFLTAVSAHTNAYADTETSGNWAGYVIESTNQTFEHAEGWYEEPQRYSSRCTSNLTESTWAGLGGWNGADDVLAQNGTAMGVPGMADHQAWWEFYPFNSMVPINFSATQGQEFDASVRWLGDSGGQSNEYRFWFYNFATGKTDAFNTFEDAVGGNPQDFPSHTAEVVIERVTVNNRLTNLLNFGVLYVDAAQANGAGFDSYPPSWTHGEERHGVHMVNSVNTPLATPGNLSAGGAFSVTQNSCN